MLARVKIIRVKYKTCEIYILKSCFILDAGNDVNLRSTDTDGVARGPCEDCPGEEGGRAPFHRKERDARS